MEYKRIISISVFILLSFFVFAQRNSVDLRHFGEIFPLIPDYENSVIKGNVKSVKETSYAINDVWGKIEIVKQENRFEDKNIRRPFYLELNKKKRIVEQRIFDFDDSLEIRRRTYQYKKDSVVMDYFEIDNQGTIAKERQVSQKFGRKKAEDCTYGSTGNLVSKRISQKIGKRNVENCTYDSIGKLVSKSVFEYDKNGNYIIYRYDKNGKLWGLTKYDKKGRVVFNNNGGSITFNYDTVNKVANIMDGYLIDNNGKETKMSRKIYYNGNHKIIKEQEFDNDTLFREQYFSYNEKGKLIEETKLEKGILDEKTVYKYNDQDLLKEKEITSCVFPVTDTRHYYDKDLYVYTYNERNLLVEVTHYSETHFNNKKEFDSESIRYKYAFDGKGNWTKLFINEDCDWSYMIERKITYFN